MLIVGGGVMGCATAWHLAHTHGLAVTVLERDLAYTRASSALSVCAIRQQFSTAINIRLSQKSLQVYRAFAEQLGLADEVPPLGLVEPGYLYLAATTEGAQVLREQHALQRSLEVHTALEDGATLGRRFPWLHTDDVTLGSLGLSTATSGEGWFDGYAALQGFRQAAVRAGVRFEECEVSRITSAAHGAMRRVQSVRTTAGEQFEADALVITAGAWSAPLAAELGVMLPVRARKRDVFAFEAEVALPDAPLLIDPSGCWFRPEAAPGRFLCGAPPRGADVDDAPLERVDHGLFDEILWPTLAHRVPAFDAVRVTASWAGYYEMNTFDRNGLVGPLPGVANAFTACGFSGHGLQQAPAVGRALAERIATGAYLSLDLSPLRVERVAEGRPLLERNVI